MSKQTKMKRLAAAIVDATLAHQGQFDKGGKPYILHPLKLQHWLRCEDEDTQIVAVLHDAIEDTTKTREEAESLLKHYNQKYGQTVADALDCITKRDGEEYAAYLERVASNVIAIKVKLKDLRHNSDIRRVKGFTQKDFERTKKYQEAYDYLSKKLLTFTH